MGGKCFFAALVAVVLLVQPAVRGDFWRELGKVVEVIDTIASPSVTNITMAADVDKGRPLGAASEFPRNSRKIHVWFNVANANEKNNFSAIWRKREGSGWRVISELRKPGPDDARINWMEFHLSVPVGSAWPAGEYQVEVFAEGRSAGAAAFKVSETLQSGSGGVWGGEPVPGQPSSSQFPPAQQPAQPAPPSVPAPTPSVEVPVPPVALPLAAQLVKERIDALILGARTRFDSALLRHRMGGVIPDVNELKRALDAARAEILDYKRMGNGEMARMSLPPLWDESALDPPTPPELEARPTPADTTQPPPDFSF